MSYLPRMSKTYKEPQKLDFEEPEENLLSNTLKPASSLLNEKGYTPQSILKHYRYHPHPLPVLPGPSLLEEALENEKFIESNRLRRSSNKTQAISKSSSIIEEDPVDEEQQNEDTTFENESTTEESLKHTQRRKDLKKVKSNISRKKSSKLLKREKSSKVIVNMCLLKPELSFDSNKNETNLEDFDSLKGNEKLLQTQLSTNKLTKSKKIINKDEVGVEEKKLVDRSNQCVIVGSFLKEFVVPPVINSLLQALMFLTNEINRELIGHCSVNKDKKSVVTQIQSLLSNLCNEKVDKEYSFEMTYSDFKRLEKIHGEIKKYLRDTYGDKSDCIDKMEDFKKVFVELRRKEMEIFDLSDKLLELNEVPKDFIVSDKDLRNPEIAIQNNRLESEQLTAELEFTLMELRNYQKSLAELDWDIKKIQKKGLKLKNASSNIKNEVLRKSSISKKFSNEVLSKGNKTLSESSTKLNT